MIGPEIGQWMKTLQEERDACDRVIKALEDYQRAQSMSRRLIPNSQEKTAPPARRAKQSRHHLTMRAKTVIVTKMAKADNSARKKLAKKLAKQFGGAASTIRTNWPVWQKTIPNDVVHAD